MEYLLADQAWHYLQTENTGHISVRFAALTRPHLAYMEKEFNLVCAVTASIAVFNHSRHDYLIA